MSANDLNFDMTTKEGKLLWAALMEMSTGFYSNFTPYEILHNLQEIVNQNEELLTKSFVLEKPENTVFCSTNSPEVQEFIELSGIKVETDNIDTQKTTKPKWQSLTSSLDGETES